jgi:hypothetical protein
VSPQLRCRAWQLSLQVAGVHLPLPMRDALTSPSLCVSVAQYSCHEQHDAVLAVLTLAVNERASVVHVSHAKPSAGTGRCCELCVVVVWRACVSSSRVRHCCARAPEGLSLLPVGILLVAAAQTLLIRGRSRMPSTRRRSRGTRTCPETVPLEASPAWTTGTAPYHYVAAAACVDVVLLLR